MEIPPAWVALVDRLVLRVALKPQTLSGSVQGPHNTYSTHPAGLYLLFLTPLLRRRRRLAHGADVERFPR